MDEGSSKILKRIFSLIIIGKNKIKGPHLLALSLSVTLVKQEKTYFCIKGNYRAEALDSRPQFDQWILKSLTTNRGTTCFEPRKIFQKVIFKNLSTNKPLTKEEVEDVKTNEKVMRRV